MNKKKSKSFYTIWTVFILASVILALFALLFASATKDYTPKATKKSAAVASANPATQSDIGVQSLSTSAKLADSADGGDSYVARLTFLGDKTIAGLKTAALLSDGANTTKVISTSDGTLSLSGISSAQVTSGKDTKSIADTIAAAKPEILVLTLGENGAAFMGQSYFTSEYTSLIKTIKTASPETIIVCTSILPVTEAFATSNSMNADTIRQANNWIQQAAADNGCKYADTFSALCDDKGYLQSQYDTGDGLVPNSTGLTTMLTYLRTHAVQ